jgi:hypothetical protein
MLNRCEIAHCRSLCFPQLSLSLLCDRPGLIGCGVEIEAHKLHVYELDRTRRPSMGIFECVDQDPAERVGGLGFAKSNSFLQ